MTQDGRSVKHYHVSLSQFWTWDRGRNITMSYPDFESRIQQVIKVGWWNCSDPVPIWRGTVTSTYLVPCHLYWFKLYNVFCSTWCSVLGKCPITFLSYHRQKIHLTLTKLRAGHQCTPVLKPFCLFSFSFTPQVLPIRFKGLFWDHITCVILSELELDNVLTDRNCTKVKVCLACCILVLHL